MSVKTWKESISSVPWCIGHRGAPMYHTENTSKSFQCAMDMGLPAIELDVWNINGGAVVVFHDDNLERMLGVATRVSDLSDLTITKHRFPDGSTIPYLNEILEISAQKCCINVELKGPDTAGPVYECLQNALSLGWSKDQFLVSSFRVEELRAFKALDATYFLGLLIENRNPQLIDLVQELDPFSIHIKDAETDTDYLHYVLGFGRPVYVYTVNDPLRASWLMERGVRAVFTDDPGLMGHLC